MNLTSICLVEVFFFNIGCKYPSKKTMTDAMAGIQRVLLEIPCTPHYRLSENKMHHPSRQTSFRTEALDLSGTPLIRAQASIAKERCTWLSDRLLTCKQKCTRG